VQGQVRIPHSKQHLVFAGKDEDEKKEDKHLEDDRVLAYYGIRNGDTLRLVPFPACSSKQPACVCSA